jgi:hypothetical protein
MYNVYIYKHIYMCIHVDTYIYIYMYVYMGVTCSHHAPLAPAAPVPLLAHVLYAQIKCAITTNRVFYKKTVDLHITYTYT